MDGVTLLQVAGDRAEELPGAEMTFPFGTRWDVYKVRGKVFLFRTGDEGRPIVTLKAAPADGEALRRQYPGVVTPGYHMNHKHWITLQPGEGLDVDAVRELVTESYLLVVMGLPRRSRPVDPAHFARRGELPPA